MKSWSVGYELIRTYVRFAFWLTHQSVVVTGRHLIPKGNPIIFAPNHQNALMDPLALACTNSYQTVWLARADIFNSKAVARALKYLKLLPVYRIRDGKDNLTNNQQIFDQVIGILENKQTIALFPEAAHSGRNQMLPHKKAIPRIAFEAEERNNFELGLQIVPVGIFYSHYWKFNRLLIVQYGEPILIDHYQAEYAENPQKAMISLRDEIYEKLCPLTLQIKSQNHFQMYENLRQMAGEAWSKTHCFSKNSNLALFYAEKDLIAKIEQIETNQPEYFEEIRAKCSDYSEALQNSGLTDEQLKKTQGARWGKVFVQIIAALFALPLFIYGFILNALPFFIPRMMLRRIVKDTSFLSTFNFVTGLIVFPAFYFLMAIGIYLLSGSSLITIVSFMLMPFAGKYAFQLFVFYSAIFQKITYLTSSKPKRMNMTRLLKLRTELIELVTG